MNIRKMTAKDTAKVVKIGNEASELAVSEESRFWGEDRLIPWVEADQDILLVAEDNSEVVGAILTNLHQPTKVGYLSDLVVEKSTRGKGIGAALLKEALSLAYSSGITYVYGLIQTDNEKIHKLLTKEGFNQGEAMYWFEKRL